MVHSSPISWRIALALSLGWASGALAQGPASWKLDSTGPKLVENMRGSVSFFYRSNELMGQEGYSSFGPQFRLDGSFLGDRFFYSANLAYNHRERLLRGNAPEQDLDEQLVGGAKVGFRIGKVSVFEVEYRNDGIEAMPHDSILFLNGHQQSSLGELERRKSTFLGLRNMTHLGSVAQLNTSLRYVDASQLQMQVSSLAAGHDSGLLPNYARRLELEENASARLELGGVHEFESRLLFALDQIGFGLESSPQLKASNLELFLQDQWSLSKTWKLLLGVAYDLPGVRDDLRQSEWSAGVQHGNASVGWRIGLTSFLRNNFPQLVELDRGAEAWNRFRDSKRPGSFNYGGLELFLGKSMSKTFGFLFSYTYSHLRDSSIPHGYSVAFGTVESDTPSTARALSASAEPDAIWRQTHLLHFNTKVQVGRNLSLGGTVSYLYASPLQFVTAEATLISPSHDLGVDVHVEKTFDVGKTEVGLMLDVFNLVNSGTFVAYDTRYDFDLAALSGRRLQLGMRYGF